VSFVAEAAQQDGYVFRAVRVWTGETEPPDDQSGQRSPGAYQSSLTLTSDQPARADRSEPD
jgi:CspA family cold shock protein